jgi:hypothetical protein
VSLLYGAKGDAEKGECRRALLAADFKADLLMMARQYLEERWPSENIPDRDVLPKYFDCLRRWPAARPRADDFLCPPELAKGLGTAQSAYLRDSSRLALLARLSSVGVT